MVVQRNFWAEKNVTVLGLARGNTRTPSCQSSLNRYNFKYIARLKKIVALRSSQVKNQTWTQKSIFWGIFMFLRWKSNRQNMAIITFVSPEICVGLVHSHNSNFCRPSDKNDWYDNLYLDKFITWKNTQLQLGCELQIQWNQIEQLATSWFILKCLNVYKQIQSKSEIFHSQTGSCKYCLRLFAPLDTVYSNNRKNRFHIKTRERDFKSLLPFFPP